MMTKHLARIFILMMVFFIQQFAFADTPDILKPDEAFQLSAQTNSPTQFTLNWQIAPEYHLYSDMISVKIVTPKDAALAPMVLPKGKPTYEATRGHFMAYYHQLSIPVTLTQGDTQGLQLTVTYQGCADIGLCFPPQHKTITLSSNFNIHSLITERSNAHSIESIFHAKNPLMVLVSFFIFGILLSLTPCIFPMLPILSSIIASHGENITSRHAFSLSFIYVFFSALTYAILGIIAGIAGRHLQSTLQNDWVLTLSGLLFIVLALSLFGMYELRIPTFLQTRLNQLSHKYGGGSLLGVALMGIFSTLVVSPCVSAPLVGALAYIGDTGSAAFGGLALFILGFGMGLPLLVIGTSAGKLLPKAGAWMVNIKNFFGILLIAMAIWIWSRVLPGEISIALWAVLAVGCSVCLGAFEPTKTLWTKFCKALGIILGLYGVCLFIGAISGSTNMLQPLEKLVAASQAQKAVDPSSSDEKIHFILIHNEKELKEALLKHHRVMVDFYADWCISCKEMANEVFADSSVQKNLQEYHIQMLKIDLTEPDDAIQAIMEKYHVIAPPTILFFDQHGDWVKNNTLVGEQSAEEFMAAVKKTFSAIGKPE